MNHNIVHLFGKSAAQFPDQQAIIERNERITYQKLWRQITYTAAYFRSKGIQKGDRILVFVPMSIDLYRITLAISYIGATAVFLDEWVSKKRMELCCQIAQCKGLIGGFKAQIFSWFSKELRQIPIKLKLKGYQKDTPTIESVNGEDPALITFTTGSSGTPKAALRTHRFLKAQFDALLEEVQPHLGEVDLCALPILPFINLGVGATSVIPAVSMSKITSKTIGKIATQIENQQVNRITASPFLIKALATFKTNSSFQTSSLQRVFTGGAPVFPKEATLYTTAFPEVNTHILYGSTEAEPMSSILASDLINSDLQQDQGLAVGTPYHKAAIKIIGISNQIIQNQPTNDFKKMELEQGEIGEIIVSGDHVLKQYYNNESAMKRNKFWVESTLWHRTGDSGFIKNGRLYLTGNCKQMIVKGNQYVSPFLIENQLQSIPDIRCGTIVNRQNQILLVIETDLSTIDSSVLDTIPHDKVIYVQHIPKDPRHQSKIDYASLGELISKEVI